MLLRASFPTPLPSGAHSRRREVNDDDHHQCTLTDKDMECAFNCLAASRPLVSGWRVHSTIMAIIWAGLWPSLKSSAYEGSSVPGALRGLCVRAAIIPDCESGE